MCIRDRSRPFTRRQVSRLLARASGVRERSSEAVRNRKRGLGISRPLRFGRQNHTLNCLLALRILAALLRLTMQLPSVLIATRHRTLKALLAGATEPVPEIC